MPINLHFELSVPNKYMDDLSCRYFTPDVNVLLFVCAGRTAIPMWEAPMVDLDPRYTNSHSLPAIKIPREEETNKK
jgi:hypothetical protein